MARASASQDSQARIARSLSAKMPVMEEGCAMRRKRSVHALKDILETIAPRSRAQTVAKDKANVTMPAVNVLAMLASMALTAQNGNAQTCVKGMANVTPLQLPACATRAGRAQTVQRQSCPAPVNVQRMESATCSVSAVSVEKAGLAETAVYEPAQIIAVVMVLATRFRASAHARLASAALRVEPCQKKMLGATRDLPSHHGIGLLFPVITKNVLGAGFNHLSAYPGMGRRGAWTRFTTTSHSGTPPFPRTAWSTMGTFLQLTWSTLMGTGLSTFTLATTDTS